MKKRFFVIIVFSVFGIFSSNGQIVEGIEYDFLKPDGSSLWELENDNKDNVSYKIGRKKLYKREYYKNGSIKNEFVRIDSVSVLHVKFLEDGKLYQKGRLITTGEVVRVDTITTFDPETYKETYFIYKGYMMVKDGWWREYVKEDRLYRRGNYEEGLKQGWWTYYEKEEGLSQKSFFYQKGKIIKKEDINLTSKLSRAEIKKVLMTDWFISRLRKSEDKTSFSLLNYDSGRQRTSYFNFAADGSFVIKRLNFSRKENGGAFLGFDMGGSLNGTWELEGKDKIILKSGDKITELEIGYIRKEEERSKIRKKDVYNIHISYK